MKKYSSLLRESYYLNRLDCGLPVFYLPKPGFNKRSAVAAVHYGSIDLEFTPPGEKTQKTTPAGVAHFLEHQLFKKPEGDIMHQFAKYGGYYNANTGHTVTSYFFVCTANFRENLDLLLKLVAEPYFTDEAVLKEKLIIEQEIRMYLDIPEVRIRHNLLNNLYHLHPVRFEIGGTVESIKEITPEILRLCHATFYHPSNLVIVLTGEMDYPAILGEIEHYLTRRVGVGEKVVAKIQRGKINEPAQIKDTRSELTMPVARPRLLIGFKEQSLSLTGERLVRQIIQTDILLDVLFGKGSRLYNQWYNEGLIDDDFAFSYTCDKTYGMTIIGGETDKPDILSERLLTGLKQAQKTPLKRREIERAKRKYLGRFVRLFDSPEHLSSALVYYYLNDLEIFDTPRYVKSVSLTEIERRLVEHLDERYSSISIIRPESHRS